jgi:hypothetical protein
MIHSDGYQDFYISIRTIEDNWHDGMFNCSTIISSPNGRTVTSMATGGTFSSEADAKAFGLDWAKAWIDNNRVAVETQSKALGIAQQTDAVGK